MSDTPEVAPPNESLQAAIPHWYDLANVVAAAVQEARRDATLVERRRVLALARHAEKQHITLTSVWLTAVANMVMEAGPVEVRTTAGPDGVSVDLVQPTRFRQEDDDA